MNDTKTKLPMTGERFLPEFNGDIVAEHFHRYLVARQYVDGKRVLDIASGEGYGSHLLAELADSVVGVDISLDAVRHASETYQSDNLEFRQGDCVAIPLPDASVDVVVSFETIEHHDRHDEMMAEIKRVLRPGGLLIISSPDRREYSDVPGYANPYHVKELYRDEFEALLDRYFRYHQLQGQRIVYGSAILDAGDKALITYDADDMQGHTGLERPVYLVALASDEALPATRSSFFSHDIDTCNAVLERETIIRAREMELEERGVAIGERDALISARDSSIDELQEKLAASQKELEASREKLESSEEELEASQQKLEASEERLTVLEEQLEHSKGAGEAYRQAHDGLLRKYAVAQTRAYTPMWLAKRFVRRMLAWPGEYRQQRHERYLIASSGLFDPAWYLAHNADVQIRGLDPLKHYHRAGGYEGRSPSPQFDGLEHLRRHPEIMERHVHPLLHYLHLQSEQSPPQPAEEGELFTQLFKDASTKSDDYVELSERTLDEAPRVRAIAFYLPQFHPIDENNRWWGKGFTEWTNVSKAVPQFVGHYQPRQPGELGFYDLRLPQVQERQVELARQHGLAAFCFHYYWFSGRKRLLETPIEQYVANPNIDFPFCICWANENWTRRWDGKENDILMEQRHEPQDNLEFIEDLAPLLKDPRYLRVDGKPVLIVYRVDIIPDARKMAETWRDYCREQGIGELHLVVAQSFGIGDPRPYGFDAAVEFPPHDTYARRIEGELKFINPDFKGNVYDYPDLVATQLAKPRPDYLRYRTVSPSWDNEARKPGRGHVFAHSTPARYQQWLAGACRDADLNEGDDKLVFINAWNEWAEGAYLEPDRRYGYAYLEATKQVMAQFPTRVQHDPSAAPEELRDIEAEHDTAVILHLYHTELWDEIVTHLAHLEGKYDLYVSLPEHADNSVDRAILADVPGARIVRLVNRGRDIAPFLTVLRAIRNLGYGQVCKIHAKRSLHRGDGDLWRREFFGRLLGSVDQVRAIVGAFRDHPEIGMIGPAGHWLAYNRYWGHPESPARTRGLLNHLEISMSLEELCFFAGSMFWCRPAAMDHLLDHVTLDDFEIELGQTDGTLAHALERVFAASCQAAGMRVTDTDKPAAPNEPTPEYNYPFALPSPPLQGGEPPKVAADPKPSVNAQARQWVRRVARAAKRRLA